MPKKFWALFGTQFWGALNDNLLKNSLALLITYKSVTIRGLDEQLLVALAGGIFMAHKVSSIGGFFVCEI